MLTFGVDIGSIRRPGGFSWAGIDDDGAVTHAGCDDVHELAEILAEHLRADELVAVAFEAPLSVPVPAKWQDLGQARAGEGRRPWSAGAGTGALATGMVQAAWICRHIAQGVPRLRATTQPQRLRADQAHLLLAEALVSAEGKPEPVDETQDQADAVAAAKRLAEMIRPGETPAASDVTCDPGFAFNLAASIAVYAGLNIAADELRLDILVAKARPIV